MDVFAKEQTYIRDYTYQASETDSKVSARNTSLLFLKEALLSEIGTYVDSSVNIFNSSTGIKVSSQKIRSITEGFIKVDVLQEKWNGVTFYIKAKLLADPAEIAKKLKPVYQKINKESNSSEEFEYWKTVVQIDSKSAYITYMSKYPQGKYHELAEIAISSLIKKQAEAEANNNWLVKSNQHVTLVVRHDTGTFEDLDSDVITNELGKTSLNLLKRYVPSNTQFNIISDFDETKNFQFQHKKYSRKVCRRDKTNLVAGVMLEDLDGVTGMYRPFRMFMYSCDEDIFKLRHFVPSGSSPGDFWRRKSVRKHLRLFIQDYLDLV